MIHRKIKSAFHTKQHVPLAPGSRHLPHRITSKKRADENNSLQNVNKYRRSFPAKENTPQKVFMLELFTAELYKSRPNLVLLFSWYSLLFTYSFICILFIFAWATRNARWRASERSFVVLLFFFFLFPSFFFHFLLFSYFCPSFFFPFPSFSSIFLLFLGCPT